METVAEVESRAETNLTNRFMVRLDPVLDARVGERARRLHTKKADVVRMAILEFLARPPTV